MNTQNFFNSYQLRKKFESDHIKRVRDWMQSNGYLNDPVLMPGTMATALILLSFTATDTDLQEYGEIILNATTNYSEPETLQSVISYLLSDPLNSATVKKLEFDRRAGQVNIQLVDDSQIKAVNLPVILTPDWKADAGIRWTGQELVSLASDLEQDFDKGELVTETEFQKIVREQDNFN